MSESSFRSRFLKLAREGLDAQASAIETTATTTGIPDAELCLVDGTQAWLELKVHDLSARSAIDGPKKLPHLEREQASWLRERNRRRGVAGLFVMARWPKGSAKREYVVMTGYDAARLYLDQRNKRFWSWADFRAASVIDAATGLNAAWVSAAVAGLAATVKRREADALCGESAE